MNKLLMGFLTLTSASLIDTAPVQDPTYPTLFYNSQNFPNGLFDKDGFSKLAMEECLITFDLNDVIFLRDYSVIWTEIKRAMKQRGFRYGVKLAGQLLKAQLHKSYLSYRYDPVTHDSRAKVWDYYLESLLAKAKTLREKERILAIRVLIQKLNMLNTPVITMVQELEQQWHTIVALTNMGSEFNAVQRNLLQEKAQSPRISEAKAARITTVIDLLSNPLNEMPCPENNWCHKPLPEMYERFFEKNKHHTGHFIFIDDNDENLRSALAHGFHIVIKFTNPEELEETLQALGLLRY